MALLLLGLAEGFSIDSGKGRLPQTDAPQELRTSPAKGANPRPAIAFEETAVKSGIDFVLRNSVTSKKYSIKTMIGGAVVFDYDSDGFLDIYFPNGARIPDMDKSDPSFFNRLYHNNGDGTFTDVTDRAGLRGIAYSNGVAAGDYDNDGWVDLYIAVYNHNQLFHNNGNGTFTDVTSKAGVSGIDAKLGKPWSITAGWFDYNDDGYLDLSVVNYLKYPLATVRLCPVNGTYAYCSPNIFEGTPNILFRNNGDGTFTDVSKESQIGAFVGKGMVLAFADYDGDGYVDVFVSNDTFQNFLFHNNRDGTFSEVALVTGVAYNELGNPVAGMGADFRDLDNDGRPDIFQTAMFGDTFPLSKNHGNFFENVTTSSGLTRASRNRTAWGTGAFDLDNDGFKDLFMACAAILDNAEEVQQRPSKLPNSILRNNGNLTFTDVGPDAGPAFSEPAAHRGAAFGDLNEDGKVDAVVAVLNGRAQLLINRSPNKNHWLTINLVGTISNRDGLGARIKITTERGVQYNHATTAVGYNSSSDKRVHFGLGNAAVARKIEIFWSSGVSQVLTDVKSDQILTITEPGERPRRRQ